MRIVNRDEVLDNLAKRGLTARHWALMSGFKPHQVFSLLGGTIGKAMGIIIAQKLYADGLIAEMPNIETLKKRDPDKRPPPETSLWSLNETAIFLNVTSEAVRNWSKGRTNGFPKGFKICGVVRFDKHDIIEWVRQQKEESSWSPSD